MRGILQKRLGQPLRWHSLKVTILCLFLPVIVIFVLVIGLISYKLAAKQTEENAYINIGDTVAQTRNYLDNRLTATLEQLVGLENDTDTLSLLKRLDDNRYGSIQPGDYIRVDRNMERIFTANYSILDSILLEFNERQLLLFKKDYMSSRITFDYSVWRHSFHGKMREYYWRNLHENDVFQSTETKNRILSVFRLFGNEHSDVRGIILFNLREEFFRSVLQNTKISENGYLVLISPYQITQFKQTAGIYQMDERLRKRLFHLPDSEGRLVLYNHFHQKILIVYNTIPVNHWKLAAVVPMDDIMNKAAFIKNITLIVMLLLIITAMFLLNLLAKIVTTPLTQLTSKVKQVKAGNLEVPFNLRNDNEIGILNNGIRDLLSRVRDLLQQVQQEQEQKRSAELAVLQAQIKPHFLYNTLDSIKQLCEMGESLEAAEMVTALAKFFRISINGGREIITLAEEIDHIQSYLLILKMRYANDFEYEISIPSELLSQTIAKLILQPLVENAIYHGTKQKRGKGLIRVCGYLKREQVILEVSDNGAGMDSRTLKKVQNALAGQDQGIKNIGLMNVQKRLQLHYGVAYGLTIQSVLGEGTMVQVILPWQWEETESCNE